MSSKPTVLTSVGNLINFIIKSYSDDEVIIYMSNNMTSAIKQAHLQQFTTKYNGLLSLIQRLKDDLSSVELESDLASVMDEIKTSLRQVLPPKYIKQLDSL